MSTKIIQSPRHSRPRSQSGVNSSGNRGFTILEVVLTMALLTIVASATILSFSLLYRRTIFKTATDEIVAHLRDAQSRAIFGVGEDRAPDNWGVYFENANSYWIFKGTTFDAGAADSFNFRIEPAVSTTATVGACMAKCVYFDKVTGRPSSASNCTNTSPKCQIEVTLISESISNYICINSEGRISVSASAC